MDTATLYKARKLLLTAQRSSDEIGISLKMFSPTSSLLHNENTVYQRANKR